MNRITGVAIAILIALLCLACHPANQKMEVADTAKTEEVDRVAVDSAVQQFNFSPPENAKTEKPEQKPIPVEANDWNKKIVKTGRMTVEVKDHGKYLEKLRELVRKQGGYIAEEEQTQSDYKRETSATLKVPVALFEETMVMLEKEGMTTAEKKIESADVTAEFVDTRSRLESRKLVRQRYLELLKQSNKMSDILEVEQEINAIQEEIEAAAGRMQYLSQSAAMSTIHLSFYQVMNADAADQSSPGFITRLIQSLKAGAAGAGELLLFLVSLWPFLLVVAALVWGIRRSLKKSQRISSESKSA